jgi:N-acyl-D-amino-acid deacylase
MPAPPSLLALVVSALLLATPGCSQGPYDLLIRGGTILDGTGAPPFTGDVAIRGERIDAVGDLSGVPALQVLDARGLYVAPGFIDLHSHAAGGLESRDRSPALPLLAQGITTAVINPDGGGAVDQADQRERLLEHGLGVNVIQLVPHGSVRAQAMGGSFDRAPDDGEIEAMRRMVREGMEAGAFGLSTGLFYTPGNYATTDEVIDLARVVAEYGGVHSSHIRDEADYSVGVVAAVQEIIRISRETGVVGVVSHVKALGPRVWGAGREIVEVVGTARGEGVEVWADQYPYDASATSFVAALVPTWAREGGGEDLQRRLEDPEVAPRIRAGIRENLERRGGPERIMFRSPASLAGRTLADLAREEGRSPVDAAFELVRSGRTGGIISFNMSEEDIELLMAQPWTLTSTDGELPVYGEGSPHPRGYGAFPRKIREYVLEREVIDLPFAIRSMTGASAEAFRIRDRGKIRAGAFADLVVFDLERIDDPATYLEPHQYARGMVWVLVNGVLAIDEGEFTGALGGRVLHLSPRN